MARRVDNLRHGQRVNLLSHSNSSCRTNGNFRSIRRLPLKIYTQREKERLSYIFSNAKLDCHSGKFPRGGKGRTAEGENYVPPINQRFLLHLGDHFARWTASTTQSNLDISRVLNTLKCSRASNKNRRLWCVLHPHISPRINPLICMCRCMYDRGIAHNCTPFAYVSRNDFARLTLKISM